MTRPANQRRLPAELWRQASLARIKRVTRRHLLATLWHLVEINTRALVTDEPMWRSVADVGRALRLGRVEMALDEATRTYSLEPPDGELLGPPQGRA